MAKCVELQVISFKMEQFSLHPIAKCLELQEIGLKNAHFSHNPTAEFVELSFILSLFVTTHG